jgi:predicted nucleic acid-binding protein
MATPPPYLVDTNIILALVRDNDLGRYLAATYAFAALAPRPAVSIVTVGELHALAGKFTWGGPRCARLSTILTDFVQLNLSDEIVAAYGEIDTASHFAGYDMGKNDLWIAATARHHGLTLLTTDRDFDHLGGTWIDLEWVDPAGKLP